MSRDMKTILLVLTASLSDAAFQCHHHSPMIMRTPHSASILTTAPRIVGPPASIMTAPALSSTSTALRKSNRMEGDDEEKDEEETIDWDAEWKKTVVEKKNQRPGKEFYRSGAERAAIRATRAAQERLLSIQKKVADSGIEAPDIRSLRGDGKFWISVLAIISVGFALLFASGQSNTFTNDTFDV